MYVVATVSGLSNGLACPRAAVGLTYDFSSCCATFKKAWSIFEWLRWRTSHINMAAHNAGSLKPTELHGNAFWLEGLCLPKPRNFVPTSTDRVTINVTQDGRKHVSGSKGLKGSQAYTAQFARNVLVAFVVYRGKAIETVDDDDDDDDDDNDDDTRREPECPEVWESAEFAEKLRLATR